MEAKIDTYSEEYRHACECKGWAKQALRLKAEGKVDVQAWWVSTFDLIKHHRGGQAAVHLEQGVQDLLVNRKQQLLEELSQELRAASLKSN
jgi:hypothetical protein